MSCRGNYSAANRIDAVTIERRWNDCEVTKFVDFRHQCDVYSFDFKVGKVWQAFLRI